MKNETKYIPYIPAANKMMIKRLDWKKMGLNEEQIQKIERTLYESYLSDDIAKNIKKTIEVDERIMKLSNKIEKDSRKASIFFISTVITAIGSILISISI